MKRALLLLLALSIPALFQGCDNGNQAASANSGQKKLRLAFVGSSSDNFWAIVRLGCDSAAREAGDVDLDFRTPLNRTAAAQRDILNDLVSNRVDGIAISPIDAENQTALLDSVASNTMLVCVDSDAEKSKRTCYIGTDNLAAGAQAADLVKSALPQGGKIALFVGYPTAQNAKERIQGITRGLAGSGIEVVETFADNTKSELAQKNAQEALAKYPDLAGVVGLYSYDGPAILAALRGAGKIGKVKIVCFDEESDTLAGIAAGEIYGTVVQKPFFTGRESVLRMARYLRGDKKQIADGKLLIPTHTVIKENVADFQVELKTVLRQ